MFKKEIYIERLTIPEENIKIKQLEKEYEEISDLWKKTELKNKINKEIEKSVNLKYDYNFIWSLEDYFQIIRDSKVKIIFLDIKFPLIDRKKVGLIKVSYKNNLPTIKENQGEGKYQIEQDEFEKFSNFLDFSRKISELIKKEREIENSNSKNKNDYYDVKNTYKQSRYLFSVTIKQLSSLQNHLTEHIEKSVLDLENLKNELKTNSLEKEFKNILFDNYNENQRDSYKSEILNYLDYKSKNELQNESYYYIYEKFLSSVKRWGFFSNIPEENDLQHTTQMIYFAYELSKTCLSEIVDFPSLFNMIIFHDSGEIITGDIPASALSKTDKISRLEKKLAIKDILKQFKNKDLQKRLISLYIRAENLPKPIYKKSLNNNLNSKEKRDLYISWKTNEIPLYQPSNLDLEAHIFKMLDRLQWWVFRLNNLRITEREFWFSPNDFLHPNLEEYLSASMLILNEINPKYKETLYTFVKPYNDQLYNFRKKIVPLRKSKNLICWEDKILEKQET